MKFDQFQTSSNNFQQVATTHNLVCKRSQHVGPNNVVSCWPTMLRAFARAFTLFMIRISHLKVFVDKKVEAQQIKCSTSSVEFLTDAMKAGCHNLMHAFLKW